MLLASSTKAGLDIDWNDPVQKGRALDRLCEQLDRLSGFVAKQRPEKETTPLSWYTAALAQVKGQDVEYGPDGRAQLRQGVAEDRRVSNEDPEMRHGRKSKSKSKSKSFNRYKQHLSTHLDAGLVLACAVTPANRPEEEATAALADDMVRLDMGVDELQIDRAYVNSLLADQVEQSGGTVVSKPWKGTNAKPGMFSKRDFQTNVRDGTITCPAGEIEPFEAGGGCAFRPRGLRAMSVAMPMCSLRERTWAHRHHGRQRSVAETVAQASIYPCWPCEVTGTSTR